ILERVIAGWKPLGVVSALGPKGDASAIESFAARARSAGLPFRLLRPRDWHCHINRDGVLVNAPSETRDLVVAKTGTLGQIFDLDALAQDYEQYARRWPGARPLQQAAGEIRASKGLRLEDFFRFALRWEQCPAWAAGLVLGYPVENTMSLYIDVG